MVQCKLYRKPKAVLMVGMIMTLHLNLTLKAHSKCNLVRATLTANIQVSGDVQVTSKLKDQGKVTRAVTVALALQFCVQAKAKAQGDPKVEGKGVAQVQRNAKTEFNDQSS